MKSHFHVRREKFLFSFFCWEMDSMMWRNKIGRSWFSSFSTFFSFHFIFHSKKDFFHLFLHFFFFFLILSYIYKLYQKKMLLEIKSYHLLAIFILGRFHLLLKFLLFSLFSLSHYKSYLVNVFFFLLSYISFFSQFLKEKEYL